MKYIIFLTVAIAPFLAFSQFSSLGDCGEFNSKITTGGWECIDSSFVLCDHTWVHSGERNDLAQSIRSTNLIHCPCCGTVDEINVKYKICSKCGQIEKQSTMLETWYEARPKTEYDKIFEKFNLPGKVVTKMDSATLKRFTSNYVKIDKN